MKWLFFKPLSLGLVCNTAISEPNIGFWISHSVFLDPFASHEIFHVPVYFSAVLPPTQMHIYYYFLAFVPFDLLKFLLYVCRSIYNITSPTKPCLTCPGIYSLIPKFSQHMIYKLIMVRLPYFLNFLLMWLPVTPRGL